MSQDLFAAFGVPQTEESSVESTYDGANNDPISVFNNISGPVDGAKRTSNAHNAGLNTNTDDEDDWGEFEGAVEMKTATSEPQKVPTRYQYDLDDIRTPKAEISATVPSVNQGPTMVEGNDTRRSKPIGSVSRDPNVLFNASDEEDLGEGLDDFDDFGDFEAAEGNDQFATELERTPIVATSKPAVVDVDFLGLYDETPAPSVPQKTAQKVEDLKFGQTIPIRAKAAAANVKAEQYAESWEDFTPWGEDAPEEVEQPIIPGIALPSQNKIPPSMHLKAVKGASESKELDHPPTTIPPPAVILSVFPSVFESVDNELLQPLSSQTQDIRKQILAAPKTIDYIRGYLAVLVVCTRVIAGRKLRWKRDTILAQSMRIGPASSGRLSGMKVTSIDKSETNREDREVAEVLRTWNLQVGKLKTVVAEAKKHVETLPSIPEIRETMPIKIASELEGGVTSVKGCALCGLKRNERIGKVDADVDDSFGEWWDDKVIMHRGMYCTTLKDVNLLTVIYSLPQFLG
jgi:hypothetical protein